MYFISGKSTVESTGGWVPYIFLDDDILMIVVVGGVFQVRNHDWITIVFMVSRHHHVLAAKGNAETAREKHLVLIP